MAQGSSSTKKAARLAQQRSTGSGPRFQGGVFPLAMMLVIVLGVATIVYARASRPDSAAGRPAIEDHWHAAYGFNICGTWYQLSGALEEANNGQLINTKFARTGVHSHNDGVIHWHPYSGAATGENAKMGVFFENYGVEVSDDQLKIDDGTTLIRIDDTAADATTDTTVPDSAGATTTPATTTPSETTPETTVPADEASSDSQGEETIVGPKEWDEGSFQCDGKPVKISMRVWNNYQDDQPTNDLSVSLAKARLDSDFMVFGIYVTSDDEPRDKPPWFSELPALGSADIQTEDLLREDLGTSDTINRDKASLPVEEGVSDSDSGSNDGGTSEPVTATTAG